MNVDRSKCGACNVVGAAEPFIMPAFRDGLSETLSPAIAFDASPSGETANYFPHTEHP